MKGKLTADYLLERRGLVSFLVLVKSVCHAKPENQIVTDKVYRLLSTGKFGFKTEEERRIGETVSFLNRFWFEKVSSRFPVAKTNLSPVSIM